MTPQANPRPRIPAGSVTGSPAGPDRHAQDLETLWRLVLGRERRLERLLELRAPAIVLRNERRMLRAALVALLDASGRLPCARRADQPQADAA